MYYIYNVKIGWDHKPDDNQQGSLNIFLQPRRG